MAYNQQVYQTDTPQSLALRCTLFLGEGIWMRNYNWLLIAISVAVHLAVIASLQLNVGSFTPVPRSVLLQLHPQVDHKLQIEPEHFPEPNPEPNPVAKQTIKPRLVTAKPFPVSTLVAMPTPHVETVDTSSFEIAASTTELVAPPVPKPVMVPTPKLPAMPEPVPQPVPAPPNATPAVDVVGLLRNYAGGVKREILAAKLYPATAERLGQEGVVQVGFTVASDGSLDSVRVKSSSGYGTIDAAAIRAVQAAAPFNAIPTDANKDSLSMSISLKFHLE